MAPTLQVQQWKWLPNLHTTITIGSQTQTKSVEITPVAPVVPPASSAPAPAPILAPGSKPPEPDDSHQIFIPFSGDSIQICSLRYMFPFTHRVMLASNLVKASSKHQKPPTPSNLPVCASVFGHLHNSQRLSGLDARQRFVKELRKGHAHWRRQGGSQRFRTSTRESCEGREDDQSKSFRPK